MKKKIQLWKEICKQKEQMCSSSFSEQTISCIKKTLATDAEDADVQFSSIECSSSILEFITQNQGTKDTISLLNTLSIKVRKEKKARNKKN